MAWFKRTDKGIKTSTAEKNKDKSSILESSRITLMYVLMMIFM